MPRPRVAGRLPDPGSFRVALVCAPAGSGKTTLLSEWFAAARAAGARAAWLSLDRFDTPGRFVAHLLAAFDQGCPGSVSGALRAASERRDAPLDEVVAQLIQGLEAGAGPAVLVLDDYHEIADEAVHGAIDLLVRYAPRSLSIVIGTRHDPPLSLERLRVRGELVHVRWDDLRFTLDEARQYFRGVCRLPLAEDQIRALCHRSEGWITALQLTAMSVRGAPDADRFVSAFRGTQPEMAAYLIEEVLRHEQPELRRFLLQTAVLETMTAPLCDAVTGRNDAQEVLEGLVRRNLFTFALDEGRTWFRYHHLFLDVLRARAAAEHGDAVAAVHDRASDWFERNGDLPRAVHHALAGRRFRRAARLLETSGREDFRQGNFKELRRSVEALPDAIVQGSPVLCVLHAWALGYQGEVPAARERIASAEGALMGAPAPVPSAAAHVIPLRAELQVLRAILAIIENDEPGEHAVGPDLLSVFPDGERALRAFAAIAVGYGERARGDLEAALAHFRAAVELSDPVGSSLINSLARLNVGVLHRLMGRSHEARRFLEASLARAREQLWVRTFGSAILRYALALVLHDEGRPEEAAGQLSEAIEVLEASDSIGFIGMALVERARNHAALRDAASTAADLARAREVAEVHGIRRVAFHADLLEARLAIRAGDTATARCRLEAAESFLRDQPLAAVLSERQEALRVGWVRLATAEEHAAEAIRLAAMALRSASAAGRRHNMTELLILQSVAWSALGNREKAAGKLAQALDLLEGEDVVGPFAEAAAPLVPLLRALRNRPGERAAAERLLRRIADAAAPCARPEPASTPPQEPADERLHLRETQILELIALGLRNREIGERLFLSEETVKWYLKRLFAKLDVRSRTEAIATARRKGILA